MRQFFNKRLEALSNPKIKGDIISNIGVGLFVNALYSFSLGHFEFMNYADLITSIILVIEGAVLKEET